MIIFDRSNKLAPSHPSCKVCFCNVLNSVSFGTSTELNFKTDIYKIYCPNYCVPGFCVFSDTGFLLSLLPQCFSTKNPLKHNSFRRPQPTIL